LAKATALAAAVNIRNGVSNATFDSHALSTGALDVATAISTLGTDAEAPLDVAAAKTFLKKLINTLKGI
jgi:hypothetical protein